MAWRRRVGGRRVVGVLLAAVAACAGCSEGLFSDDPFYGQHVDVNRLRNIDATSLERFKVPSTPGQVPRITDETAKLRFAGVESASLTLAECRASALEHNLDLKVALVDPAIARQTLSAEEAKFEATFTTRALWSETDTPTSSELSSGQAQVGQVEPGVTIPLRTGGTATVSLPYTRQKSNNSFTTLNPAYESDLQFSISQPLLRGAGVRANTASIRIASYNEQASEARTKLEAIRQLAAVDRSYWRLFQARRRLEVAQQQYELADAQLKRSERRVNAGQVGEIEVTRSQAGLADRLQAIITAQNDVLTQQRELKSVINMPGLTVESKTLVVPATPPDPVEYVIQQEEVLQAALANRMELLELELQLAADAATIDFNKNAALPLFTMDYTYRVNGLGRNTKEAFRVLGENQFDDWSLGLSAQIPIGNEAAKSVVRRSILARLQRLATKDARELAIRREVLDAVDNIEAGWQKILASRQAVILNTRAMQAEQRQFDVGGATSNDVLDAATRLAEAQFAEIQAVTEYQIGQIDLAFATGTLLGAGKVQWEPALTPSSDTPTPSEKIGAVPATAAEGGGVIPVPTEQPGSIEPAPPIPAGTPDVPTSGGG